MQESFINKASKQNSMEAEAAKENQMAPSIPSKSSNLFKTLWEAFIFLIRNWKPLLIFTFLYFISFLLSIFKSFSVAPIFTNLSKNFSSLSNLKPPNPDFYQLTILILSELREITIIEAIFLLVIFVFSTLLLTSTLSFMCMTYADNKQPAVKELFSKLRKTWKGTMITQFYVTIFGQISALLMVFLIVGSVLLSVNSAICGVVSFSILILAVILFLYLAMIWSLSVVVSVEDEEGSCGLAAIVKATEIMKGRRRKGTLINILLLSFNMGVSFFIFKQFSVSEMKKVVIFCVVLVVFAVLNVFSLAVIALFYFECKERDVGVKMVMKNECGFGYSSLPSKVVDSEIP